MPARLAETCFTKAAGSARRSSRRNAARVACAGQKEVTLLDYGAGNVRSVSKCHTEAWLYTEGGEVPVRSWWYGAPSII